MPQSALVVPGWHSPKKSQQPPQLPPLQGVHTPEMQRSLEAHRWHGVPGRPHCDLLVPSTHNPLPVQHPVLQLAHENWQLPCTQVSPMKHRVQAVPPRPQAVWPWFATRMH